MRVDDADAFYTTMGVLTQEMLESSILNADSLIKVRTSPLLTHQGQHCARINHLNLSLIFDVVVQRCSCYVAENLHDGSISVSSFE